MKMFNNDLIYDNVIWLKGQNDMILLLYTVSYCIQYNIRYFSPNILNKSVCSRKD